MVVPPQRDGSYNGQIHINGGIHMALKAIKSYQIHKNGGIHMVLKPRFITYQILDL